MAINESIFSNSEKIIFALRDLYLNSGYKPYKMSKFEEYDLYADNKNFLVSDNVITFTDTNGKLMALKPDVTLSIIKNSRDLPDLTQKVFYGENVYRVSKSNNAYREIMQTGLECFGKVGFEAVKEVIVLAAESLLLISENSVLSVSDLDIIEKIVEKLKLPSEKRIQLFKAISEKNIHEITEICEICEDGKAVSLLTDLVFLHGKISNVLPKLEKIQKQYGIEKLFDDFIYTLKELADTKIINKLIVDFSIISDMNYYNGIVFKGFIKGIPNSVLSGGRYDKLMKKMGHKSQAIGFAVYTDVLDRVKHMESMPHKKDDYLNIALPKGRLGEKVYSAFEKAGFPCPAILENNRKLIFENSEKKVRYFWVKPSDVAIYVERGAADIGVAGKDILLEYSPDIYELLDLKMGKCKMAVAAPQNFNDDMSRTLKVATKFSNIAKNFYLTKGRDIDIIHLNGSIEIAPILGLSDVIVDIVETGTTLKENNLEVMETIFPISARLIVNKSIFKFKEKIIEDLTQKLSLVINDKND